MLPSWACTLVEGANKYRSNDIERWLVQRKLPINWELIQWGRLELIMEGFLKEVTFAVIILVDSDSVSKKTSQKNFPQLSV